MHRRRRRRLSVQASARWSTTGCFVHGVHLKRNEIERVAEAGSSVITNPASNAYSSDGIAPVKTMFELGVNVGLGSDGAYVNCSMDMVQQMKFAALIQNVIHYDPTLISSERALEMATINTAKALGIDHLVGSLEVGKKADIAIFDFKKTHITVPNRPIGALVFTAHGTDVDTVIVNGKVLLRDGKLVGFPDEASSHRRGYRAGPRRDPARRNCRQGLRGLEKVTLTARGEVSMTRNVMAGWLTGAVGGWRCRAVCLLLQAPSS